MVDKHPDEIVCCCGDFNLPDINSEGKSVTLHRYVLEINELALNMSTECGFSQMVHFPTQGSNTLDLFFTSHPSLVQQCVPLPEISDHCTILTTMKLEITYPKSTGHKVYLWNQADLQEMKHNMLEFSSKFLQDHSIETPVESLVHDQLLSLLNTFVPSKIEHNNSHKPWINRNIKRLRRRKQNAYNKARSTNLPLHWAQFKDSKKKCKENVVDLITSICLA